MGLRRKIFSIRKMCELTYIEPYFECSTTMYATKKSVYLCSQTLVSHGLVSTRKIKNNPCSHGHNRQ